MKRRGVTLLETVVAVSIVSIVVAAIAPVMSGVADEYAAIRTARADADTAAFAIDSIIRELREAPSAGSGEVAIVTASASEIAFDNGTGYALIGDEVVLATAGGARSVLAEGVDELRFRYVGSDGVASTSATPAETDRVHVTIVIGDVRLVGVAWLRVHHGGGA